MFEIEIKSKVYKIDTYNKKTVVQYIMDNEDTDTYKTLNAEAKIFTAIFDLCIYDEIEITYEDKKGWSHNISKNFTIKDMKWSDKNYVSAEYVLEFEKCILVCTKIFSDALNTTNITVGRGYGPEKGDIHLYILLEDLNVDFDGHDLQRVTGSEGWGKYRLKKNRILMIEKLKKIIADNDEPIKKLMFMRETDSIYI